MFKNIWLYIYYIYLTNKLCSMKNFFFYFLLNSLSYGYQWNLGKNKKSSFFYLMYFLDSFTSWYILLFLLGNRKNKENCFLQRLSLVSYTTHLRKWINNILWNTYIRYCYYYYVGWWLIILSDDINVGTSVVSHSLYLDVNWLRDICL